MTDRGHDRPTGDEYRTLLAELSAPPADERVDWNALHARIEAAAALPLARLRGAAGVASARVEPLWWELTAGRARALLPLAAAASLAMFAYIQRHPVETSRVPADARDAYAAAVTGGASSTGVTSLLVGAASDLESSSVMVR